MRARGCSYAPYHLCTIIEHKLAASIVRTLQHAFYAKCLLLMNCCCSGCFVKLHVVSFPTCNTFRQTSNCNACIPQMFVTVRHSVCICRCALAPSGGAHRHRSADHKQARCHRHCLPAADPLQSELPYARCCFEVNTTAIHLSL